MSAPAPKLVLFDCDGTLVDSAHIIQDCMVRSFKDFGHEPPALVETKSIIGLTLDLAIARLLDRAVDAEVAAMTARYKEHFMVRRSEPGYAEPLYDGVAETIAALAARHDILMGVVTGKSRRGLAAVIERHGFSAHLPTWRTADDCPSKPHPAMVLECCAETGIDPADTIVVGDAVFDMQMADAAGATGIGVAWGYTAPAALIEAGAHRIIDRPEDLLAVIATHQTRTVACATS